MSPLNIYPEENIERSKNKKNKKFLRVLLVIGLLALVPIFKSTFAAQITIANGPVQFGQGVVQAVACDAEILVRPESAFVNVSGAGSYKLLQVVLTGIDEACDGKAFAIKIYDDAGGSPLASCTGANYEVVDFESGSFCNEEIEYSYKNDTLTVSFGFENIPAADVFKIGIEETERP